MTRSDEQRQQIRALLEQRDELARQRAALERELAAELAKLTPRQREIIEQDGPNAVRHSRCSDGSDDDWTAWLTEPSGPCPAELGKLVKKGLSVEIFPPTHHSFLPIPLTSQYRDPVSGPRHQSA
jgi:hypothetical protein